MSIPLFAKAMPKRKTSNQGTSKKHRHNGKYDDIRAVLRDRCLTASCHEIANVSWNDTARIKCKELPRIRNNE